jgi:class 3 adenylate cyclase
LPTDPSACLNWIGNFEGGIALSTGKPGTVKKVACCLKGDEACIYQITWPVKTELFNLPSVLGSWVFGIASGVFLFRYFSMDSELLPALVSLGISMSLVFHSFLNSKKEYQALSEQFENYHSESDEKYYELQNSKEILDKNYQEAQLLESLAKEIQRSDQLTNSLNATVNAACEKFGFSHAMIMLVDPEKKFLRTTAVAGVEKNTELLWKYTVDVSKQRESGLLLSSVYFTGQPVLIADVEAHKFHLNDASRNLLDKFQSKGFVLVPIPAISGSWGVLIANKKGDAIAVNRRDLVMLQRVCQHLGIALDKRMKIEHEEKLRRVFQKFVPSRIANGLMNAEEPTLGGRLRDLTCMFIDIRDFTKLSQKYPPEVVVDVLNQFFSLVQTTIGSHGGMIDKFLGDGVFVSWGATGEIESGPKSAVLAALEILQKLELLDERLAAASLPRIRIGVGINHGPAIVGNIGSNDRMEFTAIGPTVNLASRLEGLSKVHGTEIVVSESVLERADCQGSTDWKVVEGVEVRGLDKPIRVGVFVKKTETREKSA